MSQLKEEKHRPSFICLHMSVVLYEVLVVYSRININCQCSVHVLCTIGAQYCVHVSVCDRESMNVCLTPSVTQIREEASLESHNKNLIKPI